MSLYVLLNVRLVLYCNGWYTCTDLYVLFSPSRVPFVIYCLMIKGGFVRNNIVNIQGVNFLVYTSYFGFILFTRFLSHGCVIG